MSPGEYADKLRSQLDDLKRNNRPFQLAVYGTVAESSERIFDSGTTADGRIFSYNSTTPLYIQNNPDKVRIQTVLTGKGKTGKNKFKDGKEHKTTYFKSYRELRELQGLQGNFVDWTYIGELKSDFINSPKDSPASSAKPVEVSPFLYIQQLTKSGNIGKDKKGNSKYDYLVMMYGDFLNVSPQEETKFYDVLEKQLRAIFEA